MLFRSTPTPQKKRKQMSRTASHKLLTHDLPTNWPSHDPAPPPGVARLTYHLCRRRTPSKQSRRRRTSCPQSRRRRTPCPPSHAPSVPADLAARPARSPEAATRPARRADVAKRSRPALRPLDTPATHLCSEPPSGMGPGSCCLPAGSPGIPLRADTTPTAATTAAAQPLPHADAMPTIPDDLCHPPPRRPLPLTAPGAHRRDDPCRPPPRRPL